MKIFSFIFLFVFTCFLVQCGGSASTSSTTTTTTTTATSEAAQTVPSDLVLSSPTAASSSASASVSGLVRSALKAGDADGEDYVAKKEALQTLIAGEGDCAFTINIGEARGADCYGPTLDYQNHPNGPGGIDQLPGGDLAIWNETNGETGEACAAAQMNYLVDLVSSRVDSMINVVGSMACAGKKADITLPEIAEAPLDMKDEMTEQVDVEGLGIEAATIDRLEDDTAGNEQYESTLNVTFALPGGETAEGQIILKHIPLDADNTTYKGKLSFIFSDPALESFNCSELSPNEGTTMAGTIVYQKASETDLKYEMKSAQFCGTDADPLDENNDIVFADKVSGTNADGWGDNGVHGQIAFNPATNVGTFQYAWQAGHGDNATRVFNLVTTAGDDGTINGDAYAGFGPAIQDEDPTINGFICNWAGPGQTKGVGNVNPDPLTQYQKIRRTADETVFGSSSADLAITFAPTNNCDYVGGTFKYDVAETTETATNDNLTGAAVTNDLLPLSTYETNFTPLTELSID